MASGSRSGNQPESCIETSPQTETEAADGKIGRDKRSKKQTLVETRIIYEEAHI